ncbi:hypothetical protein C8R44DRAFT_723523 [Mycena epipterygia]|nr:hypothetical protein C8R44DRAFT_723523 [Mycena epipterygia]
MSVKSEASKSSSNSIPTTKRGCSNVLQQTDFVNCEAVSSPWAQGLSFLDHFLRLADAMLEIDKTDRRTLEVYAIEDGDTGTETQHGVPNIVVRNQGYKHKESLAWGHVGCGKFEIKLDAGNTAVDLFGENGTPAVLISPKKGHTDTCWCQKRRMDVFCPICANATVRRQPVNVEGNPAGVGRQKWNGGSGIPFAEGGRHTDNVLIPNAIVRSQPVRVDGDPEGADFFLQMEEDIRTCSGYVLQYAVNVTLVVEPIADTIHPAFKHLSGEHPSAHVPAHKLMRRSINNLHRRNEGGSTALDENFNPKPRSPMGRSTWETRGLPRPIAANNIRRRPSFCSAGAARLEAPPSSQNTITPRKGRWHPRVRGCRRGTWTHRSRLAQLRVARREALEPRARASDRMHPMPHEPGGGESGSIGVRADLCTTSRSACSSHAETPMSRTTAAQTESSFLYWAPNLHERPRISRTSSDVGVSLFNVEIKPGLPAKSRLVQCFTRSDARWANWHARGVMTNQNHCAWRGSNPGEYSKEKKSDAVPKTRENTGKEKKLDAGISGNREDILRFADVLRILALKFLFHESRPRASAVGWNAGCTSIGGLCYNDEHRAGHQEDSCPNVLQQTDFVFFEAQVVPRAKRFSFPNNFLGAADPILKIRKTDRWTLEVDAIKDGDTGAETQHDESNIVVRNKGYQHKECFHWGYVGHGRSSRKLEVVLNYLSIVFALPRATNAPTRGINSFRRFGPTACSGKAKRKNLIPIRTGGGNVAGSWLWRIPHAGKISMEKGKFAGTGRVPVAQAPSGRNF